MEGDDLDGYWTWLGKGAVSGAGECVAGVVTLAIASPLLAVLTSPWWLLGTVPMGLFLITHALYRVE